MHRYQADLFRAILVSALLALLLASATHAAPGSLYGAPFMNTYTPEDYDRMGQCFDVAFTDDGIVYIANGGGVLTFDGRRWRAIENTGHQAFLAIVTDSLGRVWAGGTSDFGLLAQQPDGTLAYTALEPEIPDSLKRPRSYWRIRVRGTELYLQTPMDLLRYRPGDDNPLEGAWNIWPMKEGESLALAMPSQGKIWVKRRTHPLETLEGDSFVTAPGASDYPGHTFFYVEPYDSTSLLLTSLRRGVHIYDRARETISPLPGALNDLIGSSVAYGSTRLPSGHYAVATTQHGVVVYNRKGEILERIGQTEGLPTVVMRRRGVLDANRGLWVPNDFGVARIEVAGPLRILGAEQGLDGAVLGLKVFHGTLYAATSRDLYRLEPSEDPGKPGRFVPVEGMGRAVWWAMTHGDYLYAGSSAGLFQVGPDGRARAVEGTDGNVFAMGLSNDERYLFVGVELKGVYQYRLGAGGARIVRQIYQTDRGVRFIHHDEEGYLWAMVEEGGITTLHRGKFDPDGSEDLELTDVTESIGIKGNLHDPMVIWRDRIWLATRDGLFGYDGKQDRFLPDEEILGFDTGEYMDFSSPTVDRRGRLYVSADINRVLRIDPDDPEGRHVQTPLIRAELRHALSLEENPENGFIHAGGDDGYVLTYDAVGDTLPHSPPDVLIPRIIANGDSVISGHQLKANAGEGVSLPWSHNSLRVQWTTPPRDGMGSEEYQYKLHGLQEEWSDWSDEIYRDFNDIPPGRYRFEVHARDLAGEIGPSTELNLVIQPPWYRTAWAWILWGLLVVAVVGGVVRLAGYREKVRRERLEAIVRQRTEELARAQALEQEAEIKAKQMEAAYRMAATLAHEFNNPLAVIMTSIEVAMNKPAGSPERERLLKKIPPQVERMSGLIDKMLKIEDLREIDYASGMKILDLHGEEKKGGE